MLRRVHAAGHAFQQTRAAGVRPLPHGRFRRARRGHGAHHRAPVRRVGRDASGVENRHLDRVPGVPVQVVSHGRVQRRVRQVPHGHGRDPSAGLGRARHAGRPVHVQIRDGVARRVVGLRNHRRRRVRPRHRQPVGHVSQRVRRYPK